MRQPKFRKPRRVQRMLAEIFAAYADVPNPDKPLAVSSAMLNLHRFRTFIGHEPTTDDLTEANVTAAAEWLTSVQGLPVARVNRFRLDLNTVWQWAAQRRLMDTWPSETITRPNRSVDWEAYHLQSLREYCDRLRGHFCGVPKGLWWRSLLAVAADSGVPVGSLLMTVWSDVDLDEGWITIRGVRPSRAPAIDVLSRLHPATVDLLRQIQQPSRVRVWPSRFGRQYFLTRYRNLLERAKLPFGHGQRVSNSAGLLVRSDV